MKKSAMAEWPERLFLRDTGIHDDSNGRRIYTTAGSGYDRVEYARVDKIDKQYEHESGYYFVWDTRRPDYPIIWRWSGTAWINSAGKQASTRFEFWTHAEKCPPFKED